VNGQQTFIQLRVGRKTVKASHEITPSLAKHIPHALNPPPNMARSRLPQSALVMPNGSQCRFFPVCVNQIQGATLVLAEHLFLERNIMAFIHRLRTFRSLLTFIWLLACGAHAAPAQICPVHSAVDVDPRQSLLITETDVVSQAISLRRVFDKILKDVNASSGNRLTLWQQWWDTQNLSPGLGFGPNCDNFVDANGAAQLNNFPLDCPRNEGTEIGHDPFDSSQPGFYYPIALVNRFDLAPRDGTHCGEYRVIFARDPSAGEGRNLIIFEAVLPNPRPGCGLEGCREVAQFWAQLSKVADPAQRARMLARFYFRGLPDAGVAPVISAGHFSAGTGQIRTNQFMTGSQFREWQLREFKLARRQPNANNSSPLAFVPVTTKSTAWGPLFSDNANHSQALRFKRDFLSQIDELTNAQAAAIGVELSDQSFTGQSTVRLFGESDYSQHFDDAGLFASVMQSRLNMLGSGLSPDEIVSRAETQTCAGCHQLSNNEPLGQGLIWPASLGFVHVHETQTELIGGAPHFLISDALKDSFLPQRARIFEGFLGHRCDVCPSLEGFTTETPDASVIDLSAHPDSSLSAALEAADKLLRPAGAVKRLNGVSRPH
jgi:hypothetical protein